ncbi:MAG: type IV secretion system DNA-binding domain-containing protein [Candidatus Sumerlaeota bacterium]|nr:type IV secretion system DNA-binding domain-containing protein [Candidatus Sumerlaeota bacterium]
MGSYEQAMIASARPQILAAKARACIEAEICKGCMPDLAPSPVSLEPVFHPIAMERDLALGPLGVSSLPEDAPAESDLVRFRVWISPEQRFDWVLSELFLKQMVEIRCRAGIEVVGNKADIRVTILCHRKDTPTVKAAFQGPFDRSALSEDGLSLLLPIPSEAWANVAFVDFFPPAPYSHLLTQPQELQVSTYETLIAALAVIPPPAVGFCQVLFQPVDPDHDWGRNIQTLLNFEYSLQLLRGGLFSAQYPQQGPSHSLTQMAKDVETKAHNDKPFFAVALRLGVVGAEEGAQDLLSALIPFSSSYRHGGRGLHRVSDREYRQALSPDRIKAMFHLGLSYRPGFLLNSSELCGLAHFPPASIFERRIVPLETLKTLPIQSDALLEGCQIGTTAYAGVTQPVCIPWKLRSRSAHYIGRPGTGKSTLMEHNILQDILERRGVAVLDPHGDLVERVLRLIPEDRLERIVYFNPGDPDYVPLWNPLRGSGIQDQGRVADDLVASIKSVVEGWGDRLENVLRFAFLGLLCMPDATLQDVSDLLRRKSKAGEILKKRVLTVAQNESVRKFWSEDFDTYQKSDLTPPQHKLSKLLASGTYAEMLSQPLSLIDFRKVMDNGMALLIDLSGLGSDVRDILGCFMLSSLRLTVLCRSSIPMEERRPFQIYCDEAHRFTTGALEDIIAESRKYGVGLTLAHQYLSQFTIAKRDALASVGATVIFNVDTKDAAHLKKDLQDKVDVNDLITLKVGEAIARIGTEIVRLNTLDSLPEPTRHFRDRIIAESRRRYYKSKAENRVLKLNRERLRQSRSGPLSDAPPEETPYDEL